MKTSKSNIHSDAVLAQRFLNEAVLPFEEREETEQDRVKIQENLLKAKSLFEKASNDSAQVTSTISIKLGSVFLHLARYIAQREQVKTQIELAISTTEQALLQNDPELTHTFIIEGYLTIVEGYIWLSNYQQDIFKREQVLDNAVRLARACNYICLINNEDKLNAKLQVLQAYAYSKRFKGDRDASLYTAIFMAEEALVYFRNNSKDYPLTIPKLFHQMGNNYAFTNGDRRALIGKALKAYDEGLRGANDHECPLLVKSLKGNINWAQSLLKENDLQIPTKEMVMRFKTKVQDAIHSTDWQKAMNTAWEFLQWSWSLHNSPNIVTADAHLIIACVFAGQSKFEQAIPHAYSSLVVASHYKSIDEDSKILSHHAKNMLVDVLEKSNQAQETIQQYLVSSDQASNQAIKLCQAADKIMNDDPNTAFNYASQATQWYPFLPNAYFYMGVALYQLSQYQQAIDAFTQVININPHMKGAWLNRGTTHSNLGNFEFAQRDLKECLKLAPNDITAKSCLVKIFSVQKEFEKALELVNGYSKEHPDETIFDKLRDDILVETKENKP